MRDKRMFQLSSGPRGKYVYHRSPSGRKVTRNVPNSVVTKNDAVRFLRESGGRGATRATPARPVPVVGKRLGCDSLRNLTGVRRIGSGRQGVIYAANRPAEYLIRGIAIKVAPFDNAAEKRGEKQPAQVEYDIQSALRLVAQGGIMSPMSFHECRDFVASSDMNNINKGGKNIDPHRQFVLFMERADGGSLSQWVKAHASTLNDSKLFEIIGKVLVTLWKISKKYPEFRHNDLHLDNILMVKNVPKIADFGWSRIQKTGTNPAVNTALKNGTAARYGIGPDTDPRYDAHLFLNELRRFLVKFGKFNATIQFLNKYIPVGYREFSDTYTHEGRLKYSTAFPGLPTIRTILKDSHMNAKLTPSPKKTPSPQKAAPSPKRRRSPAARANAVLTNANFLAMTPRRFMKLTPKTRARATIVRRAGVKGQQETARSLANSPTTVWSGPKRLEASAKVRVSPRTLRSNNFNKLVVSFLNKNNSAPYQNRWNAARAKAIKVVKNRLTAGKPAFSPKRPKLPSPLSPLGPPKPRPKLPSPLSPLGPPKRRPSPAGVVRSAGSGRYKITGPSGRLVYANGTAITMNFIKNLAARKGVAIKGLRSKDAIAKAIFNRK